MFDNEFLEELQREMVFIEKNFPHNFVRNRIKHKKKEHMIEDGDFDRYDCVANVLWLQNLPEDVEYQFPRIQEFKNWAQLFKATVNKHLHKLGKEVDLVEEQYLHYDKGGHYVIHKDTYCNPLKFCEKGDSQYINRLLTYLIYFNPGWKKEDGGELLVYDNFERRNVIDRVTPKTGQAIIFRSDQVYHSAEYVYTEKRAITLFIQIKDLEAEELDEQTIQ